MQQKIFEIKKNKEIAKNIYEMKLGGEYEENIRAGQFINIKIEGFFLRRPICVCDYDDKSISIVYKTVGAGTKKMSQLKTGDKLDLLIGLGNGYNLDKSKDTALVVGAGPGTASAYCAAKQLKKSGKKAIAVLGFNTKEDIFYKEKFEDVCDRVYIATLDGSEGTKGFVTDIIKDLNYTYAYVCGPEMMMRAVYDIINTSAEFSFEARMGCGFGACMGCSCKTKYKTKRICKDGPVLEKEEIIW